MRQRLRRMERRGPWELGLATALGAALFGTLVTVVLDRGELQLESIRIPIEMFFAALSLLLLVAWLAQDLTKRAQIAQFQADSRDAAAPPAHRAGPSRQAHRRLQPGGAAGIRQPLHESGGAHGGTASAGSHGSGPLPRAEQQVRAYRGRSGTWPALAHILRGSTRGSDVAARYGGDEFVLLLAETTPEGAEVVISRVQEQVRAYNDQAAEGHIPLSFSTGIGIFQKGMDFEALFRVADLDLLRRKAERRGTAVPAARD